jgi:hypothetical protein
MPDLQRLSDGNFSDILIGSLLLYVLSYMIRCAACAVYFGAQNTVYDMLCQETLSCAVLSLRSIRVHTRLAHRCARMQRICSACSVCSAS